MPLPYIVFLLASRMEPDKSATSSNFHCVSLSLKIFLCRAIIYIEISFERSSVLWTTLIGGLIPVPSLFPLLLQGSLKSANLLAAQIWLMNPKISACGMQWFRQTIDKDDKERTLTKYTLVWLISVQATVDKEGSIKSKNMPPIILRFFGVAVGFPLC